MAMKVYKMTKPGNLSTVVKGGVRISFDGMMHMQGTYSTDNAELQKAIEGSPQYGKEFVLAYSSVVSAPTAAEAVAPAEAVARPDDAAPVEKPNTKGRPKGSKQL